MRLVYVLFIVVPLFLVGCSGTPDQVERNTSLLPWYVPLEGEVAWDAIENPPVSLEIMVIMEDGAVADEGSIFVSQLESGFDEPLYLIHYPGNKYRFEAIAPAGYTVTSGTTIYVDPLTLSGASGLDFVLEKD